MSPRLGYYTAIITCYLTLPGSGKMVALEQHHDRQVLSDRAEIIIELLYSCKVPGNFSRIAYMRYIKSACVELKYIL